ncbi:MAG: GAF domain-containing protein [Anaerolineales bacterium]|jgi:signal transduction histidine kinase|nr:MAG: GAF domain-containing protein [Anaerolineales bacterium]
MEPQTQDELTRLRQMVVRLSRLVEISVTLNSTLDLDRLLQFIVRSAADLVESEAASILLVGDKTRDLYIAAATDADPETLQKIPVPKEGSIAGTVFREDRPLILNELGATGQSYPEAGDGERFSVRSLIGVPLRIRDDVTGVLEAVNKRQGIFDEVDLLTLTNIASLAAVAISNARQLEALNRAYDALGNLDQLKTDFIAIASHELRTPLGLILGNASLLKELSGEDVSEHADAVLNSAMRMRVLIEDMTNLNMLQAGSANLVLSKRSLQHIVQLVYEEAFELVEAREQTIKLSLPTETLEAMVDEQKITLALTNLLNNAIRFTPKERELRLTLEQHGHEAWLRVHDDGIGLVPDELETVFDSFYQVEDHLTRQHDGLGLGLPIVKAIAESHGGRVWVESEGPDQGATFTIALPLVQ